MHKTRVGVIRGGPSSEYEVSLKTGATVLQHLSKDKYEAREIHIDRKGEWHMHGLPITPHEALTHIDVAFNALHGTYGEDGAIQHIFEIHGIPYTGSGSFASALGMNKHFSKEIFKKEKIKTAPWKIIESGDDLDAHAKTIFRTFSLPLVVKPASGGSSIGMTLVKKFTDLVDAIKLAFKHSPQVIVEEYIVGKEATCGVIEWYRDQEYYALPAIEIQHSRDFFDYAAKYEGQSKEIVPGNFTDKEKKELESLAVVAHKALGLRHYSRSDFIIHPKRGIFILETNTLPGLTEQSLIPKALGAVGAPLPHFLDHLVQLAISRK